MAFKCRTLKVKGSTFCCNVVPVCTLTWTMLSFLWSNRAHKWKYSCKLLMTKKILWQELEMVQRGWTILGNNVLQQWCNYDNLFYVHVTVHRNKFLYNKTKQMHQFPKFTPAWDSTCFGQFLRPSSGVYSPYTRHWYMSYRFEDSFQRGPWWNCSSIMVLLESCLQTGMAYTSAECTVNKLLMMGRETARNM
jgi:hypothetical protein